MRVVGVLADDRLTGTACLINSSPVEGKGRVGWRQQERSLYHCVSAETR